MAVLAHLDASRHASDRRSADRRALSLAIDGTSGAGGIRAVVHDLSETGFLFETSANLGVGDQFDVVLPHVDTVRARVVWTSGNYYGCEFQKRITPGSVSAALLRSEPKNRARNLAPAAAPVRLSTTVDTGLDHFTARRSFFIIVGASVVAWAAILIAFFLA